MKSPLSYWFKTLLFGLRTPVDSQHDTEVLVRKYARGNVNLKRGRYITHKQVEQQRVKLSRCRY